MNLLQRLFGGGQPAAPPERVEPTVQNLGGESLGDVLTAGLSGVVVNETTAMRQGAVYACVQLLAGILTTLPLHFYSREGGVRKRVDHDYWWLFNESATNEYTAAAMWEYGMESRLLDGDMLCWLVRDRRGKVVGVQPMDPRRVNVKRMDGGWRMYTWWRPDGTVKALHEDDVLHVSGLGFDGLRSLSPIRHHAGRSVIGLALAQDEFGERSLGQGNHADVLLSTPAKLSSDQKDELRTEIETRYNGLANTRRPMVLSGDFKLERLKLSPVDVQLLEARQFSVVEIARIFGVLPHMIGATDKVTSWGSGIESMTLGFIKFTLKRHLQAIQQEINRKLFPRDAGLFCEFELDALQEGDGKSQGEYFGKALGGPGSQGWMTVNEVRRRKNLPPVPGGDIIYYAGASNADSQPADPSEEPGGAGQDQGGSPAE
ncbi:phage portal protein [Chromobacterium alkanivorans]|uniref:phage portal protein n=1 Tax=Chromobacterium alkanivorans TaxID=1071719 RepID=UPI001966FDBC|nr:phage portal protein [Chromobacterium alkanivorans]MBN3004505.1 phage portal protein [Chromobacterium alkanivorans]